MTHKLWRHIGIIVTNWSFINWFKTTRADTSCRYSWVMRVNPIQISGSIAFQRCSNTPQSIIYPEITRYSRVFTAKNKKKSGFDLRMTLNTANESMSKTGSICQIADKLWFLNDLRFESTCKFDQQHVRVRRTGRTVRLSPSEKYLNLALMSLKPGIVILMFQ